MKQLYYILSKRSITALIVLAYVFSAVPVFAMYSNDTNYVDQQYMWSQIGAQKAWDFTTGTKHVTVAIIDTGADTWNSDLKPNIWVNPYEIPGNGYDDDRNGYIDDINGWNFVENNNDVRTSVLDEKANQEAVNHGTVISGLVGAVGNNKKGGSGLNWNVQIMPIRAIDNYGSGYVSDIVKAVRYAMDNGADVIGLSFATDKSDDRLKNILYEAYKKGVVIVAAAGNDRVDGSGNLNTHPLYPVCLDEGSSENWIVGVSSVNKNDGLSRFADYGACVDLVAPGENIFGTQRFAPVYGYKNEFGGPWQGTSFAVPLVAGSAALVKSIRPDWGAKEIVGNLLYNAQSIDRQNVDFVGGLGYGRIDVGKAVENAFENKGIFFPITKKNYLFKGGVIYASDVGGTRHLFYSVGSNVQIIALTYTASYSYKRDEVFTLIKRGGNYFIQFFNENGVKWKEKAIPKEDFSIKKIPVNLKIVYKGDKRYVSIDFSEKVSQNGKKTQNVPSNKLYDWLEFGS